MTLQCHIPVPQMVVPSPVEVQASCGKHALADLAPCPALAELGGKEVGRMSLSRDVPGVVFACPPGEGARTPWSSSDWEKHQGACAVSGPQSVVLSWSPWRWRAGAGLWGSHGRGLEGSTGREAGDQRRPRVHRGGLEALPHSQGACRVPSRHIPPGDEPAAGLEERAGPGINFIFS